MLISLLQLNINSDNYWDTLIPFLTTHNFDIMQMQEVTGKDTHVGNIHSQRDVYKELQHVLGNKYNSELMITQRYASSPDGYLANATFYKKDYKLLAKQFIIIHGNKELLPPDAQYYGDIGRGLIHLTLLVNDKPISFLNLHGAWAKTTKEQPHQTEQSKKLLSYLQSVRTPFIFSGDLNLDPEQPMIQKISKLARNLVNENKVTTTLNPRTHRAKHLFPPGAAVDYIFVSNDLSVTNFQVLNEDLSDHLGLTVEVDL